MNKTVRFSFIFFFLFIIKSGYTQGLNLSLDKGISYRFIDNNGNSATSNSLLGFNLGANGYAYGFQSGIKIGFLKGDFMFPDQSQKTFRAFPIFIDFSYVPDNTKMGKFSVKPIISAGGGFVFMEGDYFDDITGSGTANGFDFEVGSGIYIGRTFYYHENADTKRFNMTGFIIEIVYQNMSVSYDKTDQNYNTSSVTLNSMGFSIRLGIRIVLYGKVLR